MREDAAERRLQTLRTLIDLASTSDPGGCWGDDRAEALLRSQVTAAEARAMGMSEQMIERIWSGT